MSSNLIGSLVAFKYNGGSTPGSTKIVTVSKHDGFHLGGGDHAHGCAFRNFSINLISDLQVLANNPDEVNIDIKYDFDFAANYGVNTPINPILLEALVEHCNKNNKDKVLYISSNVIISVSKKIASVKVDTNSNGVSLIFTSGFGQLEFYIDKDKTVSVGYTDKNGLQKSKVFKTPIKTIPLEVINYLKEFVESK